MKCDKHPLNVDGNSPKELAKKFVKTNYFFQKEFFKYATEEYQKEAKGDKKRGKIQLTNGLEGLIQSIKRPVSDAINKICNACKNYLENPFE